MGLTGECGEWVAGRIYVTRGSEYPIAMRSIFFVVALSVLIHASELHLPLKRRKRSTLENYEDVPGHNLTWKNGASLHPGRWESQGALLCGQLYSLGGFGTGKLDAILNADRYNMTSDSWSAIASLPRAVTHAPVVPFEVSAEEGYIFLMGGYLGRSPGASVADVWLYSVHRNRWYGWRPLPARRAGGVAVMLQTQGSRHRHELHWTGGAWRRIPGYTAKDSGDHFVMDVTAHLIRRVISHAEAVERHSSIDCSGATFSPYQRHVNYMHPGISPSCWPRGMPRWRRAPGWLSHPRNHMGGAALGRGQTGFLAMGGQHAESEHQALPKVDFYNGTAERWYSLPDWELPFGIGHIGSSVIPWQDRGLVLVIGGSGSGASYRDGSGAGKDGLQETSGVPLSSILALNIRNGFDSSDVSPWSLLGHLPDARKSPTVVLLQDRIVAATWENVWISETLNSSVLPQQLA